MGGGVGMQQVSALIQGKALPWEFRLTWKEGSHIKPWDLGSPWGTLNFCDPPHGRHKGLGAPTKTAMARRHHDRHLFYFIDGSQIKYDQRWPVCLSWPEGHPIVRVRGGGSMFLSSSLPPCPPL